VHVEDGFLAAAERAALREALALRRARGELDPARIGTGQARQLRRDLRGDSIGWLRPPWQAAEAALLDRLELLRVGLNRELLLGLFEIEAHYAHYPPGARYARHVDRPQRSDDRVLTFVLYLNENWAAEAGGALRLYEEGRARDILPVGGRLVLFLAEEREHEVLPASRDRLSVTGWFRRRPIFEGARA
jgi:SM-20-related protein